MGHAAFYAEHKETVLTGLIKAVDGNHVPVVKLLVEKFGQKILKIHTKKRELGAHNAVTMAACSRIATDKMLLYLLDNGGNPNSDVPIGRKHALHLATTPHLAVGKVSLLVERGAGIENVCSKGNTALDDLKEQYRDDEDGQLAKMIALFVHALGDKSDRVNLEDKSARQNRLDLENVGMKTPVSTPKKRPEEAVDEEAAEGSMSLIMRGLNVHTTAEPTKTEVAVKAKEEPAVGKGKKGSKGGKGGKGKGGPPTGPPPKVAVPVANLLPQRAQQTPRASASGGTMADSMSQIAAFGDPAQVLEALKAKKDKKKAAAAAKPAAKKAAPKAAPPMSFDDELKAKMAKQKVKMESGSKSPTKTPAKPEKNTKQPVEKELCPADELRNKLATRKAH